MKKIFLLLVAMISVSAHAQNDSNAPERKNWDRPALYGNVKSLTVTDKCVDEVTGKFYVSEVTKYKFDKNGDVIEHCFAENEAGITKYKYKYDENRNLIEMTGHNSKGVIVVKCVYTYNEHGKIADEILYIDGDLVNYKYKLVYRYTAEGVSLGGIYYGYEGDILEKYDYIYNEKGERIKELYKNKSYVIEYDDNGNIISQIRYNSKGEVKETMKFAYNDKNLQTSGIKYNHKNEILEEVTTIYDDKGNIIEITVYEIIGSTPCRKVGSYKYDDNGREIESYVKYTWFTKRSINEYDSHNNLTSVKIYDVFGNYEYVGCITTYKIKYR